jgi:phage baseplate assembly protein W
MRVETILGRGIVTPMRRTGRDFAFAEGADLVRSRVRQILQTEKGEIRWRPDFGVPLNKSRHRNMTDTFLAEVQADVMTALTKYESQIEITGVTVEREAVDSTTLIIRVGWRAVARSSRRNTVLTDPQVTEVVI